MNCASPAPSTLAKMMNRSAKPPLVIHIFSPLSTKMPSGWRVARVLRAERVGSGSRLAQAIGADDLAGEKAGQVLLFLRFAAEERERDAP